MPLSPETRALPSFLPARVPGVARGFLAPPASPEPRNALGIYNNGAGCSFKAPQYSVPCFTTRQGEHIRGYQSSRVNIVFPEAAAAMPAEGAFHVQRTRPATDFIVVLQG